MGSGERYGGSCSLLYKCGVFTTAEIARWASYVPIKSIANCTMFRPIVGQMTLAYLQRCEFFVLVGEISLPIEQGTKLIQWMIEVQLFV